jgi:hypothetical protein
MEGDHRSAWPPRISRQLKSVSDPYVPSRNAPHFSNAQLLYDALAVARVPALPKTAPGIHSLDSQK